MRKKNATLAPQITPLEDLLQYLEENLPAPSELAQAKEDMNAKRKNEEKMKKHNGAKVQNQEKMKKQNGGKVQKPLPTTVSAEALLVTAPCTRCLECLEWTWWHSTPEAKCVCDR